MPYYFSIKEYKKTIMNLVFKTCQICTGTFFLSLRPSYLIFNFILVFILYRGKFQQRDCNLDIIWYMHTDVEINKLLIVKTAKTKPQYLRNLLSGFVAVNISSLLIYRISCIDFLLVE